MLLAYIKAFHVIAIIAWMAGLLYLPRLFVYHAAEHKGLRAIRDLQGDGAAARSNSSPPRRWSRAGCSGSILAFSGLIDWSADGWFHAKLVLVLLLSAFHGLLAKWTKDFAVDRNTRSPRFYRIANEVPTLLMIGIVILVVVRPF